MFRIYQKIHWSEVNMVVSFSNENENFGADQEGERGEAQARELRAVLVRRGAGRRGRRGDDGPAVRPDEIAGAVPPDPAPEALHLPDLS